jgi:chaperonin GroES
MIASWSSSSRSTKRTEDGRDRLPMTVAVGDIVVFGKYAGMETQLNDEKLMVMKEDDIIAIAIEVTDLPDPL